MLAALGAPILDADAVYHGLLAPANGARSPLAAQIEISFPGVLLADGRIDRAALGSLVFADPAARQRLEALTHPAVAQAVQGQLMRWRDAGVTQAVYDVPLLYEKGLEAAMDGVAVVWVPASVQHARLMGRDNLSAAAAQARLDAQLPIDEKRRRATWVIDNSGSLAATQAQVQALWAAWQAA